MQMQPRYNPFSSDLKDLSAAELGILKDVAEGWYVEYKSDVLSAKKVAKSLASFANHYGGWIFYGVAEAKDGSQTAGSFPGLEQSQVGLLVKRLRDASRNTVTPPPYYDYRIIKGPCSDIGLDDSRSIVVVRIPSGPDPPYIHSDGRIYRRVADSSDPKPETDRFTLDHLWQKGQRERTKLASFLEQQPILSEAESDLSYLDVFLLSDPFGVAHKRTVLPFDTFAKLMKNRTFPMPCDNVFTMSEGYVARQVMRNDPYCLCFTWRYFFGGASIVSIPFSSTTLDQISNQKWLNGYAQEEAFLNLIEDSSNHTSHLLDINQLFVLITAVVAQQRRLMEATKTSDQLYSKAVLHNVWRRVPFLDTESYIEFVRANGFPVLQCSDAFAPPGTSYESLSQLTPRQVNRELEPNTKQLVEQYMDALPLFAAIVVAVGLPPEMVFGGEEPEDALFTHKRAAQVSSNRGNLGTSLNK